MTASKQSAKTDTKHKKNRPGIGIRWRLWGYLSAFVVLILVILAFFQVGMLDRFYERIKQKELQTTAKTIAAALGDEDALERAVYGCAAEYSTCVRVFRVKDDLARAVATADVSGDCIIHHVSSDYLSSLYQRAVESGGICSGKVQFRSGGLVWLKGNEPAEQKPATPELIPEQPYDEDVSALYIQIVHTDDRQEYVIMLDAVLTPMSATVSTLKTQFFWIVALLLLAAVLFAYLMSRRISEPLVRMNEAAKQLACGNYDVEFAGNGYRETRELAQTLNVAAQELSKTDRLQKELIANVSHDLRTPLTMIAGYSEAMRDLPGENTPENVQVIIDETEHLTHLVNDMLDLSRLNAGAREICQERFDLTAAVQSILQRYERLMQYDGYNISFDAKRQAWVEADRTMILQVVYNLINNAINYAGDDRWVGVEQRISDERVRILVHDHGAGISEEELPLIWDRYYKVDRVHRRATVGTGLGLSIAKGVLDMHGAVYGVQSERGQGSTFWFELPVAAEPEDEQMTSKE